MTGRFHAISGFGAIFAAGAMMAAAATPLLNEAVAALQRGDNATAERELRAELRAQPNDAEALSFLGVALDNQKKFQEADALHKKALALAPDSNSILDKYATHQLAEGDEAGARRTFAHALALIPGDGYANLELAALALKEKKGPEALTYLDRLSAAQRSAPDVEIDRVLALELSGRHEDAAKVEAEILRTGNADVLYSLAYAYDTLKQPVATLRVLARAAELAPERADIERSLATAAGNVGDYQRAFTAWEHYARLKPGDDAGRRERGFAAAHVGKREQGLADLRWYTGRHPEDADGWYEQGIIESSLDPTAGMPSFDKAIALRPGFALALSSRGALNYRDGKPEAALPDLERAAGLAPSSAMTQYRLGQAYQALDRLSDAIVHYRRAAELAPNDYEAQFHLANALAEAGQTGESDALLERIRTWPRTSALSEELPGSK